MIELAVGRVAITVNNEASKRVTIPREKLEYCPGIGSVEEAPGIS
jgi:hypothetical protein